MKLRRIVKATRQTGRRIRGRAWLLRSLSVSRKTRRRALEFLEQRQDKMLFVVGAGRSGTQLVSGLLDLTNRAIVFHEPDFNDDVETMDQLRRDTERAVTYWREYRARRVFDRWSAFGEGVVYGEVNGTIRYQIPAIKRLFPQAHTMLISRDGRGVVRSVMGWPQFYNPKSRGAYALSPLPDDPFYEHWKDFSRFEKVCWAWRDANESPMRQVAESGWIRVEQLAEDFDYCQKRLLFPLGLDLLYDDWLRHVSRRSPNSSTHYGFPPWEEWNSEQQNAFVRICGDTMSKLGYRM